MPSVERVSGTGWLPRSRRGKAPSASDPQALRGDSAALLSHAEAHQTEQKSGWFRRALGFKAKGKAPADESFGASSFGSSEDDIPSRQWPTGKSKVSERNVRRIPREFKLLPDHKRGSQSPTDIEPQLNDSRQSRRGGTNEAEIPANRIFVGEDSANVPGSLASRRGINVAHLDSIEPRNVQTDGASANHAPAVIEPNREASYASRLAPPIPESPDVRDEQEASQTNQQASAQRQRADRNIAREPVAQQEFAHNDRQIIPHPTLGGTQPEAAAAPAFHIELPQIRELVTSIPSALTGGGPSADRQIIPHPTLGGPQPEAPTQRQQADRNIAHEPVAQQEVTHNDRQIIPHPTLGGPQPEAAAAPAFDIELPQIRELVTSIPSGLTGGGPSADRQIIPHPTLGGPQPEAPTQRQQADRHIAHEPVAQQEVTHNDRQIIPHPTLGGTQPEAAAAPAFHIELPQIRELVTSIPSGLTGGGPSADRQIIPHPTLGGPQPEAPTQGVALPPLTGHGIGPSSIPETLNNDRQLIPYSEARAKFYGPSRREAPLGADHGLLNNVNNSYDDVFQDAHSYFDDIDNAITDNLAQFTLGTRGERAAWDQTIEQAPPTAQATYFNNIAADADPVIAEELPREFHDDNWITSLHSQHEKDLEPAEASEWHDAQDTMPWDISQFATLTVPWQVPWDFSRLAGHDEAIQPLPIPEHDEQINQLAEAFGSFQPVEPHGSIPLQFLSNELNKPLSRQNSGQINGLARNDVQELHQELGNQQEPSNQINGSPRNHVRELHQELGNQQEPLDWYALAVALDKQYRDGLIQPNNR